MLLNKVLELHQQGDLQQAEKLYKELLKTHPEHSAVLNFYGYLLVQTRRSEQALPLIQKSIQIAPDIAQYYDVLGAALDNLGQSEQAAKAYVRAGELEPEHPKHLLAAAKSFRAYGDFQSEIACLKTVLPSQQKNANVHHDLAIALQKNKLNEESLKHYLKARELDPGFSWIHYNLAVLLQAMGQFEEAMKCFEKTLQLNPGHLDARNRHFFLKRLICDWSNLNQHQAELEQQLFLWCKNPDEQQIAPFNLNILGMDPEIHYLVAKKHAEIIKQRAGKPLQNLSSNKNREGEIRVGYLSADFCLHAVGSLLYKLFGQHDKHRFDIFCYSLRKTDDVIQKTIKNEVGTYRELETLNFREAASIIQNDHLDILVDLGGYTKHSRTEILALRSAPIQISYLGYLNTMGADFIDYIIADPQVLPLDEDKNYVEKILRLPGCFMSGSELPGSQFSNSQSSNSVLSGKENLSSREEQGLPATGFIFCSFNNPYKLTPALLDCWCEILKQVSQSCLWLYAGNQNITQNNLTHEFKERGIEANRIIFAKAVDMEKHQARIPLADLFLDAFSYNAGATALSTLFAGVPVLSLKGQTMLSRMTASMNHHLGMQQLITEASEQYIHQAVKLANNSEYLHEFQQRLIEQKETSELFDINQLARMLEKVYSELVKN